MKVRLGSRKSPLALWQTRWVAGLLEEAHPGLEIEVVTMDTIGDKIRDVPLPKIGAKGLFTQELEQALVADEVDMAIHSLKDLPTRLPEGLKFQGAPRRASPADAFISTKWKSIEEVPEGAVIGTGSMRRQAQIAYAKPGVRFEDLRGNIDTRLRKLHENGWDGIIMAAAALHRLEAQEHVAEEMDVARFVPAVSQGAVGIEVREGRPEIDALIEAIVCPETMEAVLAERHFLRALEGGCSVPLGAHAHKVGGAWHYHAWVGLPDGSEVIEGHYSGPNAAELAHEAVADFEGRGAHELLERV